MSRCRALEGCLDLRGIDVHAAGDDHVLLAVADVVETLFVEVRDITNGVIVTDALFFILFVGFVVGLEYRCTADEEALRERGLGDLIPLLVDPA